MATLTDISIEHTVQNIAGLNPYLPFQYIALGSGTTEENPASGDLVAELTSNGLERALATIEYISPNKIRWSHTFLATGSATVAETGLFNGATANEGDSYLRHVLAAPISLYTGDELEIIFIHTME
jgi:hypothetical protein